MDTTRNVRLPEASPKQRSHPAASAMMATPVPQATQPFAPDCDSAQELRNHPRYRILRLLGEGGMGAVYLAEHRVMKRSVALKVIKGGLRDQPDFTARFRREVKVAGRLQHPNIVAALDAETFGDSLFLVMEYVEGVNLHNVLRKHGRISVAKACDIARQIALALDHAHRQGLTHGDIKPDNIMLSKGRVKVLDFGLASLSRDRDGHSTVVAGENAVYGTPDYMAPEQTIVGRTLDGRADLYSLGCTLYQMLAGKAPFADLPLEAKVRAHREGAPQPLSAFRNDIPPKLQAAIDRLLAKHPSKRYADAAEAMTALAPFGSQPKRTSPVRKALHYVGVACACVTLGVGLAFAFALPRHAAPAAPDVGPQQAKSEVEPKDVPPPPKKDFKGPKKNPPGEAFVPPPKFNPHRLKAPEMRHKPSILDDDFSDRGASPFGHLKGMLDGALWTPNGLQLSARVQGIETHEWKVPLAQRGDGPSVLEVVFRPVGKSNDGFLLSAEAAGVQLQVELRNDGRALIRMGKQDEPLAAIAPPEWLDDPILDRSTTLLMIVHPEEVHLFLNGREMCPPTPLPVPFRQPVWRFGLADRSGGASATLTHLTVWEPLRKK